MFAALFAVAGVSRGVGAQTPSATHTIPTPVAGAVRRTGAIIIDGKLDDAAWNTATPITVFRQYQPVEGAPPTQRTEVRVLFDEDALYIGARMYDSLGAAGVRGPLARRDQLLDNNGNNGPGTALTSDKLAIVLDPYHNHLDRVWFEVNPAGVKGDAQNDDSSFDPIWEAAARVDSAGWTAEMRIPFSQLRFSRDSSQTWGLQIWRNIDRLNEQDMWSFWKVNEAGGPSRYGHLHGIAVGHRPRQLEVLPYVVSRAQFKYAAGADPFHRSTEGLSRVGGDLKYLLTSNLTLDATVNPDFGQVEVDPAVVNLSAFETFYQEKRPFFVAGSSAYSFGEFNCFFCDNVSSLSLFYSRRIGRAPQENAYVSDNSTYADLPENTTILGAAKITGRTANGFTVGLLDALTNRATARLESGTAPITTRLTQEVEPLSNYFVGRVRREYRGGQTTLGGIFTSTLRSLDDSLILVRLRRRAEAVGVDLAHTWDERNYSLLAQVAVSDVGGSDSAITRTQQSSAHYFQRPDYRARSDGLFSTRFEPAATALRGYGFYARVGKNNGNWLWETAQNWRSPGFEVNDLAFMRRADYKWMLANLARQWTQPTQLYRNLFIIGGAQQQFNYDGDRNDAELHGGMFGQFANYWGFNLVAIHHPTSLDDRLMRGGPVVKRTGYDFLATTVSTDARRVAVVSVSAQHSRAIDSPAQRWALFPTVALKPASNVYLSLAPAFDSDEDSQGYVTSVADPTATLFYGRRYVFAFLRQRTVSLDTRINVTFTPNLTLELFAQPFISSGEYTGFREFAAPRGVRKLEYGRDVGRISYTPATPGADAYYTVNPGPVNAPSFTFTDPNFTFRSLRGNAVLRWEYRPGSTMFFVWTQQRSGADAVGQFDFARERGELFRDRPTNIFQIKVNYWIGR
ncbi:MAG: hypothetical protein NVS4B3_01190 [Gemmatimonadaceae bacterium]